LERGNELEPIRLKVFDLYVTHYTRLNPHITFSQFWDDFLLSHIVSEKVTMEETFQNISGNLRFGKEPKELSN
jgi:hypothetical protein